jgi:hypothetical protein
MIGNEEPNFRIMRDCRFINGERTLTISTTSTLTEMTEQLIQEEVEGVKILSLNQNLNQNQNLNHHSKIHLQCLSEREKTYL